MDVIRYQIVLIAEGPMPALIPTHVTAEIVWLGFNPDRDATLRSISAQSLQLSFAGFEGESHAGLTRPSDSRVLSQYPRGTTIRNTRQLSIVSQEDLDVIAANMGVVAVDPAWVGASLVLRGIPDFTHIPPASRLQNAQGTTLTIDMENRPCHLPAKVIDEDANGYGKAFKAAAYGLRGVTAWVEREGVVKLGEIMRLHIPDQPIWPHLATTLTAAKQK
jgi:hypothetical protein